MQYVNKAKRLKVIGPVVLVAILCLAVVAQGQGDGQSPKPPTSTESLATYLPVFGEDRGLRDALPRETADNLADVAAAGPELHPELSRFALAIGSGASVYLVPTDDGVCAVYTAEDLGSPTCASMEEVSSGKPIYGELLGGCTVSEDHSGPPDCQENRVTGIAPGSSSVELTLGDGEIVLGRVSNGVFTVVVDPTAYVTEVSPGK